MVHFQVSKLAQMKGIGHYTTELYSHAQPSPGWIGLGLRPLVWLSSVLGKNSQQK